MLQSVSPRPIARIVDFARPSYWELMICCGLLSAYVISETMGETACKIVNEHGPILFAGVLIAAAFRMGRITPFAIWTPLFWYRVSTAVFFGIGNIAHTWMNWYTFSYYTLLHNVTLDDLYKFNLIVTSSHVVLLIVLMLCTSWFRAKPPSAPIADNMKLLKIAALGSCFVGYSVKYLIQLPSAYGVFGTLIIPNVIIQLSLFAPPGLFLLAILARSEGRAYGVAAFMLLMLDIVVGAIGLTKIGTLLPLLVYLLAFLYGRVTVMRAAIATAILVSAFAIMQPMLEYGRNAVEQRFGDWHEGTPAERFDLLVDYWTQDTPSDDQMQGALSRIAYLNATAAAMELYDSGRPGTSLGAITWIFIPRLLWPEKPSYSIGADFTMAIQGIETTATWMGYFGEGYYNYGFWGELVVIPLAVGLFILSRYAYFVLVTRRWLHLPGVFLGVLAGIQTDGSLIGALSVFIMVLLMHPPLSAATSLLQSYLRRPRRRDHANLQGARPRFSPSGSPAVVS